MSISRIKAIILQEFYITRNSLETIIDLFWFALINIIVFGYFAIYLSGGLKSEAAVYLILGLILWEIVRTAQYSVAISSLWNIWSRNLSNMFIAPLTIAEFITAQILTGILKSILVFLITAIAAYYVYGFNVFQIGWINLLAIGLNLILFASAIGIIVMGLIFRIGTRIQAFAWGLIFLFQPLSATLFPLSVLPAGIRPIAYGIPITYTFEAARQALHTQVFNWYLFTMSFAINLIYLVIALIFFSYMYNASRRSGQFARNES